MAFNLESYIKNYDVQPETIGYLRARLEVETVSGQDAVAAAREAAVRGAEMFGGSEIFNGTDIEYMISRPSTTDDLPVTVYKPHVNNQCPDLPVIVYFHGGGNVIKSRKTNENVCKIIARDTPCIVVSVEYRLAPEHKFPVNNDDAKSAVEWTAENKELIGGSYESKLGVIGDSAGGRLAAVVCHEAYQIIDFAIIVYPKVDYTKTYKSTQEFEFGPTLSKKRSDWYAKQYITDNEKHQPRASVIKNKDFSYLPPTLIIVAEHDQLRDGCYEYFEKLSSAGVKVQLELFKGVPHAFFSLPGAFKETCRSAYKITSDFIITHSLPTGCKSLSK